MLGRVVRSGFQRNCWQISSVTLISIQMLRLTGWRESISDNDV